MAKYQQYEEYKDSGVEWLGQVPSEWSVSPLKLYLNTRKGVAFKSADFTDIGIRVVKASDIKDKTIRQSEVFLPSSFSEIYPKSVLKEGEIIISTVGSTPDVKNSAVGQIGILPFELDGSLLNQNTVVLSPKNNVLSNLFLFYLIQTDVYREHLDLNAHGTANQASLNISDILNFTFARPTIQDQAQIANFLDHETAQIDTLIEKQQTLIQLLKEKRQAVISHAVTKGLNPEAPMKDSGVEWLGEVPEHWSITRIKYVAELTPSKSGILSRLEERCSFIPMEKLKLDTLVLDETRQIKDVYQGYTYFEDGDVLIAKVTPCFENQNMAIAANLVNGIGFGSSEIYVLRTEAEVLNQLLLYRLQESVFMQLGAGAMTGAGGLRRVPSDFLNNFQFGLPPISEQQEIVEHIEKMKSKFNDLIDNAQQAIQLMQERRTALISAAITGKIDVRGWQGNKVDVYVL